MAWKLLPTDYTDAVWSGLKRYTQVDNSDGTVSFNDVTTYTNIETLPVDVNKYLRFAEMIQTEINLLKGWRKSDNKFKSALQEGNL